MTVMETFLQKEKKPTRLFWLRTVGSVEASGNCSLTFMLLLFGGTPCYVKSLHTYNSFSFGKKSNEQHGVKVHSAFWAISQNPDSEVLDLLAFANSSLGQTLPVIPELWTGLGVSTYSV